MASEELLSSDIVLKHMEEEKHNDDAPMEVDYDLQNIKKEILEYENESQTSQMTVEVLEHKAILESEAPITEMTVKSKAILESEAPITEMTVKSKAILESETPVTEMTVKHKAIVEYETETNNMAVGNTQSTNADEDEGENSTVRTKQGWIVYCCEECGTTVEDADSLVLHHKKSHDKSVAVCDICGAQFKNTGTLYIHAKHAHGVLKTIKCVCNKIFESVKKIKEHYEKCKMYQLVCGKSPSQCKDCGEQFSTDVQYRRHTAMHRNDKQERTHICETCGKSFINKASLKNHGKSVHNAVYMKCPFCVKTYKTHSNLLLHVYLHKDLGKYVDNTKEQDQYKCPLCPELKSKAEVMKEHVLVKHNLPKYKNRRKNNKKKSGEETEEEESEEEEEESNEETEGVAFEPVNNKCEICGRVCANRGAWSDHMALHAGEVTVVCKECGRGFVTRHAYRKHMRVNHGIFTGQKRVETQSTHVLCKVCGVTLCRTGLGKHMDIHNGIFRYKCSICDKACRSRHDLTVHERVHTGEKPYRCDVCARYFSDQANLRHHKKRIHNIKFVPNSERIRKTGFHKQLNEEERAAVRQWQIRNGLINEEGEIQTEPAEILQQFNSHEAKFNLDSIQDSNDASNDEIFDEVNSSENRASALQLNFKLLSTVVKKVMDDQGDDDMERGKHDEAHRLEQGQHIDTIKEKDTVALSSLVSFDELYSGNESIVKHSNDVADRSHKDWDATGRRDFTFHKSNSDEFVVNITSADTEMLMSNSVSGSDILVDIPIIISKK